MLFRYSVLVISRVKEQPLGNPLIDGRTVGNIIANWDNKTTPNTTTNIIICATGSTEGIFNASLKNEHKRIDKSTRTSICFSKH